MARRVCWLAVAGFIVLLLNISRFSYFHLPSAPSLRSRLHNSLETQAAADEENLPLSVQDERAARSEHLKPWPSLPSFLPWLPARSKLMPQSCEAYFGNGFTERIGVFSASSNPREERCGSVQCVYSETLRTSICEGRNVVMHPERISMSPGGELVEAVIGRTDADELPSFSPGAFQVIVPRSRWRQDVAEWSIPGKQLDVLLPQGQIHDHRLRALFTSIRTASSDGINCSEDQREPTLLVTRYEYANLFHTATDWYSAYATSRVLGLAQRPHVIFVDGHCKSPMDDGWKALFSSVRYAKDLTGPVCFDRVIFTPLGYETALFKGLNSGLSCRGCEAAVLKEKQDDGKTARLREFGEVFKAAFGVVDKATDVKEILFVRRESYLAHPRHVGRPETRLQNEQELFDAMEAWAGALSEREGRRVAVINGTLAHMKMKEQVQAVHDASIIVGVHGAGLTHILFARPGTVVLELLSPLFPRPHYSHISQWMGIDYHSITMPGTHADCTRVVQRLSLILDTLWP